MFIILDTKKRQNPKFSDQLFALFKPYIIEEKIIKNKDISFIYLKYILNRGNINLKKISHYAKISQNILCDKNLSLKNTNFKRFENNDFNRIMMKNFIFTVLKSNELSQKKLKISFYDPNAGYSEFAKELFQYTSNITIVSNMPKFYENESEKILNEIGSGFIVSNSLEKLTPCDLLICPEKIKIPLPTMTSSLIFTVQKPLVNVSGTVINDYPVELPVKYREIKPTNIENNYFLSALYALCHQKELKKITPLYCKTENQFFSVKDISQRIDSHTMFELI